MDLYQKEYNPTKQIKDLLIPTLSALDLEEDMLSGRLSNNWEKLMGEKIARNVRFFRLKNGEITLLTDSSSWRFELFSRREEIIEKCNEYLTVEAISSMKIR